MSKSELEQRRQNFPKMSFYRKHAKPRMWGNFLWNQIVPYDLQDLMWPPQNYSKWKDEWMAERDLHKPLFQDHGSLGPNMVFRIQSLDHSLSIHLVYQTHWVISNNEKNTRADQLKNLYLLVIFASHQLSNTSQVLSIIKNKKLLIQRTFLWLPDGRGIGGGWKGRRN